MGLAPYDRLMDALSRHRISVDAEILDAAAHALTDEVLGQCDRRAQTPILAVSDYLAINIHLPRRPPGL